MYLLGRTIGTESILDEILKSARRMGYLKSSDSYIEITSATLARIMYVLDLNIKNTSPRIINFLIKEKIGEINPIFLKEIPEELCRKVGCIPNYNVFTKTIHFSDLEFIIYAKPDAFMNGCPVEIKSISIRKDNDKLFECLNKIGEYQAKIYSYIFNTRLSYLLRCNYELNDGRKLIIRRYAIRTLSIDPEEIDMKIRKILRGIILPFISKN